MKLAFPSHEFDEAVAAVFHGSASDEQMRGLNELLRSNSSARDEYILRLELHSRLASEPDLFVSTAAEEQGVVRSGGFQAALLPISNLQPSDDSGVAERSGVRRRKRFVSLPLAMAAC